MSTVARFTIAEYDLMIEAGVFEPREDHRVELIRGEIREMSPIHPPQENGHDLLMYWSIDNAPRGKVRVRVQNSLGIPEFESVPQPNLLWVKKQDYSRARPTIADVLLVVEVSDSSLRYDRGEKAELYAEAGVQDYWVANVKARTIEVYRNPVDRRFTSLRTCGVSDSVSPLAFPDVTLAVATIYSSAE